MTETTANPGPSARDAAGDGSPLDPTSTVRRDEGPAGEPIASPSETGAAPERGAREPGGGEPGMRALDALRAHAPEAYARLTAAWPADAAKNLESAIGYATELLAAEPALAAAFGDPALGDNARLIEAAHHAAVGRRILTADDPRAVLAELRPDLAEPAEAPKPREAKAGPSPKLARIEELTGRPDYWSAAVQAEVQRLYRDVYGDEPLVGRNGRTF